MGRRKRKFNTTINELLSLEDKQEAMRVLENTISGESNAKKYPSRQIALKDEELISFECTHCKKTISPYEFLNQNQEKTLALAKCECGKNFFVRFKFRKVEGQVLASRVTYELTEERKSYYAEKCMIVKNKRRYPVRRQAKKIKC